jgi:hypothetical protein
MPMGIKATFRIYALLNVFHAVIVAGTVEAILSSVWIQIVLGKHLIFNYAIEWVCVTIM